MNKALWQHLVLKKQNEMESYQANHHAVILFHHYKNNMIQTHLDGLDANCYVLVLIMIL